MTSKKLLSALMALVFALSLFTALPVSADATVTATVNGSAITSGATIPAVSTITFTLPNAIADADVETAIAFHEIRKGLATPASEEPTDAELWSVRDLKTPVISGNTVTFNFVAGDLALNSQYRFTFNAPAVAASETFEFYTNAKVGDYYLVENFSRYPEKAKTAINCTSAKELVAPLYSPYSRYTTLYYAVVKNGDNSYLQIINSKTGTANNYGAVGFDNAYVPAYAEGTTIHRTISEVDFGVIGNSSSGVEFLGGIIMATNPTTGKTGLYYRTVSQPNYLVASNDYTDGSGEVALGYEFANTITGTESQYTMKWVEDIDTAWPQKRTLRKLWIGPKGGTLTEVAIPVAGIANGTGCHGNSAETIVNYDSKTTATHSFSVMNVKAAEDLAEGEAATTTLNLYSYKVGTYVSAPLKLEENGFTANVSSTSATFAYDFDNSIDAATISNSTVVLEKYENSAWTNVNAAQYASVDATDASKLNIVIPKGVLTQTTQYKLSLKTGLKTVEGGALVEPTPYEFTTEEIPKATVTAPAVPEGAVSQTPTFTFNFNLPINAATLTAETVVLEEENKGVADAWFVRDALAFAELDEATKKQLTFTFGAGALAPNTTYRISLKTGILTEDGGALAAEPAPFVFTTGDTDNCILYDDFSRYAVGSLGTAALEQVYKPFSLLDGWTDGKRMFVTKVGDEKVLRITGPSSKTIFYDNGYTERIPTSERGYGAVTEYEFSLVYEPAAIYEFGGVAIETVAEDTYKFYVRTQYHSLNGRPNKDITKYTEVGTYKFPGGATEANGKHTLAFRTTVDLRHYTGPTYTESRTLHNIVFDGQEIGATVIGTGLPIGSAYHASVTLGFFGTEEIESTCLFFMAIEGTTITTPAADIYSVKHSKALDVSVSGTGAEKTIKVTNNTGAALNGNIVLAVYSGKTLVGVTGFDAVESVADGATATVTRKVDEAVAGNTYKVMFINSKTALQPYVQAVSGTIQ